MKPQARSAGFTIIELLVATAITGIILSALGSIFITSNSAYRRDSELSALQQTVDAASNSLGYEVSLAGFLGTDTAYVTRNFNSTFTINAVTQPASTLIIDKNKNPLASDKITVRYYEDRFQNASSTTTTPNVVAVQFQAQKVSNAYSLYRQTSTDTAAQPTIADITNMKVLGYYYVDDTAITISTLKTNNVTAAGKLLGFHELHPVSSADTAVSTLDSAKLASLVVELSFTDNNPKTHPGQTYDFKRQLVLSLPNTQTAPLVRAF